MQAKHALCLALICAASTASADPPPCHKWANNLDDCTALEKPHNPGGSCSTTGIEREVAMSRRFDGLPLGACKKLIKHTHKYQLASGGVGLDDYTPGEEIRVCVFKGGGDKNCYDLEYYAFDIPKQTSVHCVYDSNEDGKINADDGSYVIHYEERQPQAHCFCTAKGPHSEVTTNDWDYEGPAWRQALEMSLEYFHHVFPSGFKNHILDLNWRASGEMLDRNGNKLYKTEAIYKVPSALNPSSSASFDNEPTLQKWNKYNADAAQIDHIIPRKDSQGCLCGDATSNNAAIISLELNQTMSNISPKYNLDRARMYEKYVTCPDPSVAQYEGKGANLAAFAIPLDQLQDDESTMCLFSEDDRYPEPPAEKSVKARVVVEEAGGCSTGAASGLGIGLAFAAMRRRRKRDRAAA